MLRPVCVTGAAMTRFGKREGKGLVDLAVEAGLGALNDSGQKELTVDTVYVRCAASGQFCGITNLGPIVAEQLGLLPCEAEMIENPRFGGRRTSKAESET